MATFCARCGNPIPGGASECSCAAGSLDLGALQIEGLDTVRPQRPSTPGRPSRPLPPPAPVEAEDFDLEQSGPPGARPSGSDSEEFGAALDLEEEGAMVPSLEVDDHSRRSFPAQPATRGPSVPPPAGAPAPGARHSENLPAVPSAPAVDPELVIAAKQLAGHGECTSALQAPAYALRVRKRIAALREEVKRMEEALILAQGEAEEALARIAQCIRDPAAMDANLAPFVETVLRAEAQAKDRELAVIAADTSSAVLSDVVKQRIQQVRQGLVPAQGELQRLAPDLRAKQEAQRRVMAQVRRSEIELRNLRDLANAKETEASAQSDAGRKASLMTQAAELRGRSPEYESVLATHRATATEMQGPISDLERQMGQLRRQITDGEAEVEKLQAGQKREAAALDKAKEERMHILDAARVTVRGRLADLARAAVSQGFAADAIAPMIPGAREFADKVTAVRRQLEIYRAALEVHDAKRVQQGNLIMAGGAALVLVILIALFKLL